jgi:quercetin dioxygenase-like cupin family protein
VEHRFTTGIHGREGAVAFPGAGGDALILRIDAEDGECPVAVVEGVSTDRGWAPAHSHPWDEVTYVLEGEIEFIVGGERGGGGPGTIVSLPRAVGVRFPHLTQERHRRGRTGAATPGPG